MVAATITRAFVSDVVDRAIVPLHIICVPRSPGIETGSSKLTSTRICGSSGTSPTKSNPELLMLADVPNRHTLSPNAR